ncbi:hypothetical protein KY289_020666 [Solanum tuberosum]|nr:hypothetical protein KY289_020666 [Solanum tuberosum]
MGKKRGIFEKSSWAWTFEAIPYLRKLFKDYSEEISQQRILRWLSTKNNPKINFVDLFSPPHDIKSLTQNKPYSGYDKKKELVGATTIKREALIVPGDADDGAINVGDDADVNVGVDIGDIGAKSGGEHVDDVGDVQ